VSWSRRESARNHVTAAVTAETASTEGQAPIARASTCETTNAVKATAVSSTAVRGPWRSVHARMHHTPPASITTPPSGLDPLATATPKPTISEPAATGAVGTGRTSAA
jgi:hypothetical protein